jgi:hypothetical protein
MKLLKIIGLVAVILFGAFAVVFGGYDDSPGAQGLGVIIALAGIVGVYRQVRKK